MHSFNSKGQDTPGYWQEHSHQDGSITITEVIGMDSLPVAMGGNVRQSRMKLDIEVIYRPITLHWKASPVLTPIPLTHSYTYNVNEWPAQEKALGTQMR